MKMKSLDIDKALENLAKRRGYSSHAEMRKKEPRKCDKKAMEDAYDYDKDKVHYENKSPSQVRVAGPLDKLPRVGAQPSNTPEEKEADIVKPVDSNITGPTMETPIADIAYIDKKENGSLNIHHGDRTQTNLTHENEKIGGLRMLKLSNLELRDILLEKTAGPIGESLNYLYGEGHPELQKTRDAVAKYLQVSRYAGKQGMSGLVMPAQKQIGNLGRLNIEHSGARGEDVGMMLDSSAHGNIAPSIRPKPDLTDRYTPRAFNQELEKSRINPGGKVTPFFSKEHLGPGFEALIEKLKDIYGQHIQPGMENIGNKARSMAAEARPMAEELAGKARGIAAEAKPAMQGLAGKAKDIFSKVKR